MLFTRLMMSMVGRTSVAFTTPNGDTICGVVNGLAVEDGSGRSWIVTLSDGTTHWVRCDS